MAVPRRRRLAQRHRTHQRPPLLPTARHAGIFRQSASTPRFSTSACKNSTPNPTPSPHGTPCVELLTIHKAKGLEWDVVFIPGARTHARNRPKPACSAGQRSARPTTLRTTLPTSCSRLSLDKGEESQDSVQVAWPRRIRPQRGRAQDAFFTSPAPAPAKNSTSSPHPKLRAAATINRNTLSLLSAAWPAAAAHFHPTADDALKQSAAPVESPPLALAAAGDWPRPTLQRLPIAFDPTARFVEARDHRLPHGDYDSATASQALFLRPEGSFAARSFGNAVHASLEILARRIAAGESPTRLLAELPAWTPRIAALLRADGLPRATVTRLTRETRAALENVLRDPDGLWLLAPHSGAASEFALTVWSQSQDIASQQPSGPPQSAPTASSRPAPNPAPRARILSGSSTTRHPRTAPPASTGFSPNSAPPTPHSSKPTPASSPRHGPNHPARFASPFTSPPCHASSGGNPPCRQPLATELRPPPRCGAARPCRAPRKSHPRQYWWHGRPPAPGSAR